MQAATEKTFTIPKETTYSKDSHTIADKAMREEDRVVRWKKVHTLLRKHNKQARKEQDVTAKDAKYFRDNKLVKKDKTKIMGLRWGVAMPPMTWNALIEADILITGHSDLQHPDKEGYETRDGSNQIVKDLEKAFPQYRVAK